MNIKEAVETWVQRDMWAIPYDVARKLMEHSDYSDFIEITPISVGANVYSDKHNCTGEVKEIKENDDGDEVIVVDINDELVECERDDLSLEEYGDLPMWGCLWAFNDMCDKDWIDNEENRVKMAQIGFRIYDSEDYGYVFGIDGAGYDFYSAHWIPLYKERGLKWHDEE